MEMKTVPPLGLSEGLNVGKGKALGSESATQLMPPYVQAVVGTERRLQRAAV